MNEKKNECEEARAFVDLLCYCYQLTDEEEEDRCKGYVYTMKSR